MSLIKGLDEDFERTENAAALRAHIRTLMEQRVWSMRQHAVAGHFTNVAADSGALEALEILLKELQPKKERNDG